MLFQENCGIIRSALCQTVASQLISHSSAIKAKMLHNKSTFTDIQHVQIPQCRFLWKLNDVVVGIIHF